MNRICLGSSTGQLALAFVIVAVAGSPLGARPQDQSGQAAPKGDVAMSKPAPILVIYREEVKAGRAAAHDRLEAGFAHLYSKMPGARHYLAMNSISGPTESWFLQPFTSFADLEKEYLAMDHAPKAAKTSLEQATVGEPDDVSRQVAITALYRDDLSFDASMANLPHMRFVELVTYRVRPGHDSDFMEAEKVVRAAYEKANQPVRWATYQVFSGAPSGTYLVFRAVDSLTKIDPTNMSTMQAFDQALGEEGHKRLTQFMSEGLLNREVALFAFNPQTSFAPPEFVSADAFWAPQQGQLAQVGTAGRNAAAKKAKK